MVTPSVGEFTLIRIQLPPTEADRLEALFRSTDDRKLRDRLQIVLMAHRGRARQDIAADLGVHRKTVTRWLNAYCRRFRRTAAQEGQRQSKQHPTGFGG